LDALLYKPSTGAKISEDNASWYFAGKGGSQERIYEMMKCKAKKKEHVSVAM